MIQCFTKPLAYIFLFIVLISTGCSKNNEESVSKRTLPHLSTNATVTGDRVRLRKLPSIEADIAGELFIGDSVTITGNELGSWVENNPLWYRVDTDLGIGYIHSSLVDSGAEDSSGESAAGFCKVLQLKDSKAVLYLKSTVDNSNGILTVLTYNRNRKISEKVSSADWNWPPNSSFPENSELIFDHYILLPVIFTESTSKLIVTKNGKLTEICSEPYSVPESKYLLAFASDAIGNYGLQIFDTETGKFVYNTQYEEDAPYFLNYEYNHRAWFANDTILILPYEYETGKIVDQYHIVISLSHLRPELVSGPYPGSLSGYSELKHK